jgi:hypothetical protein
LDLCVFSVLNCFLCSLPLFIGEKKDGI